MSDELALRDDGDVVDAEVVNQSASMTLFGTDDPEAFVEHATRSANALAKVVTDRKLTTKISNREHVRVEGWTLLGSMLGVFPVCVWTRKLEDGWEARVEARTRMGEIVGAAEAECLRSESTWKSRDDYALRSMAQTRATSKALRQPLGFVMTLAGFDATPAEEIPSPRRSRMPEHPKQLSRDDALAELKERQAKLVRLDQQWKKDAILSQAAAASGETVKDWGDLPNAELGDLLRKARAASRGVEESLGIDEEQSQFDAPRAA